jgi:NAD(P)H-hydrate repair Nnr-like enzyme with NAD(P)H-hydrate epimerase domain
MPDVSTASRYSLVIDAVFGFSFNASATSSSTPAIREPFGSILDTLQQVSALAHKHARVVSIDVPSGWPVDTPIVPESPASMLLLNPDLVSM